MQDIQFDYAMSLVFKANPLNYFFSKCMEINVDHGVKGTSEKLVLGFPGFSPTREPNVSLRSARSWTW